MKNKPLLPAILAAGLLTGILDGFAAVVQYLINTGRNPVMVFRFIASGIFGKPAFDPEATFMPVWGLFFHIAIATIFTAIFFFLYPRIPFFSRNRITGGVIYGLVIWLIMNRIVLPLSNTPSLPFKLKSAVTGILILIVAVGIPVSILAARYYERPGFRTEEQ
jgi:hypothetical protein